MKLNSTYVAPDESCAVNEIVVDLQYADLVKHHVRTLWQDVTVDSVTPLPELRLALLGLGGALEMLPVGDVEGRAANQCHDCEAAEDQVISAAAAAQLQAAYRAAASTKAVLQALRADIAEKFGGWLPEMGGNHTMHGVTGFPQSKPLAFGGPAPLTGPLPSFAAAPGLGSGVRVGILDTMISDHPVLVDHRVANVGQVLKYAAGDHEAWEGHATFVAGLILQQAPAVKIIVKPVLVEGAKATVWDTAAALAELDSEHLDILNISLGCRTLDGTPPLALQRAIERVRGHGTLVIAAAGNHGQTSYCCRPTWPAAFPDVIAVGAKPHPVNTDTGIVDKAAFSPRLPWVDVLAEGVDVESTFLQSATVADGKGEDTHQFGEGYAVWSGTSFAAATVAGAVAAHTVPGKISSRQALKDLLGGDVVTEYIGG